MDREYACSKREEAISNFRFVGKLESATPYGNGHINDTFLLVFSQPDMGNHRVILQRLNNEIFKKPEEVMANILGVTSYLKKQIIANNGDPDRETLNIILTKDGKPFYKDSIGSYWRAYFFIEGATCFEKVEKEEDFYESAYAFGHFQMLLSDYPADTLYETIVGFHDTASRFETFKKVVQADVCGRASAVQEEINFVLQREELIHILPDMFQAGKLPLRVTHNDTKLNNIMIDNCTGKAVCVIDLDTVMPGFAVNDFGDSIRFGASTAAEDERDLEKVSCDMALFECYVKGYLKGCEGKLTDTEVSLLAAGAKLMTFECGMRFLTDYLDGDHYFKIHREGHNLDRCRTQFKLVQDMENKWDTMTKIVEKYGS
ncbi:phosphotransferase enzyme family protein [Hespellia stercorisuis]|uniref:Phosphotransferase enzyme family protein n=1 Tax=Hespellia stercorisuis DSM 15480 TaxID=1121950 RepID=A0A1M6HS64_9FIRM|nr:aminoglycoside phosphotransferase family protein [Hespellia stercorisuis]SHJ25018.1 Phosphotransferase enzyme family protein [Hespellia stercorisuis DSM 15480]